MSKAITFTTLVGAWMQRTEKPSRLLDFNKSGETARAAGMLWFYGKPDLKALSDWVRVGDAEITVTLLPEDEQVRNAVEAMKKLLDEERAKWLARQQEILDEISKLSALTYEEPKA
jgi:hypothetical protein